MNPEISRFEAGLAKRIRFGLLLGIVVVVGLIFSASRQDSALQPFFMRPAYAGPVAAAPGFLALSAVAGVNQKFYLIDTTKEVVCTYQLEGDKIRLVSAREFKRDTDILDSSIELTGPDGKVIKIEGGSGVDRETAEHYADGIKKLLEQSEKK